MPKIPHKSTKAPNKKPDPSNEGPDLSKLTVAERYKTAYFITLNKLDNKTKRAVELQQRPEIDVFVKSVISLAESFEEKPVDKEVKKG